MLCRPEESRNIGSVCRAMKNMAITELRVVGNRADYSDEQVRTLAVHAGDIWDRAIFFEPSVAGLRAAIGDCTIAGGTTRRMGQKRKSWGMTPEQFAETALQAGFSAPEETAPASGAGPAQTTGNRVAVVFGNERTGLTDEELDCCTVAVNIPSSPDFPSLNLSHAVQIMSYVLYRAFDARKRGYEPITLARLGEVVESISDSIDRIGLFRVAGKEDNDRFLAEILARAALSESEAKRIEQLFRKMSFVKTGTQKSI